MAELQTEPKVVIFTQPDCPPCHEVFLAGKGVALQEGDNRVGPAAVGDLTEEYSSHSTPTLVSGEDVMIGFDPERLDEILGE